MTWPNLLSTLRIALIPIFIVLLIDDRPGMALVVFSIAGITDLLDGAIARFYQQQSVLGAYLDPMADKLLMTAAYIFLARRLPDRASFIEVLSGQASSERMIEAAQSFPVGVSALVISRDVVIVVVALTVYLALGITKFPPSRISKWNTAFQIIAVYMVLLSRAVATTGAAGPIALMTLLVLYATVLLTSASGLEYANRFIYRSNELAERAAREDDGGE